MNIWSRLPYNTVDLFAGPGGLDKAATLLGMRVIGIEKDAATCQTRRFAGLATIQGDVRAYGPEDFPYASRLLASPPCQTFSLAGKGAGRLALDAVLSLGWAMARRETVESSFDDERTYLVLEPLRWALKAIDLGRPYTEIILEQVPTVFPVYETFAEILRNEGYSVVVGKLCAEQYGVPQTRRRVILVARLDGIAQLPAPTHRKYRKGVAQHEGDLTLKPWVSMAEALDWGMTHRPAFTVTVGTAAGGTDPACVGGSGARAGLHGEMAAGRWKLRMSGGPKATQRGLAEPAPTVAFGHDSAGATWQRGLEKIRVHPEEAATLQTFPRGYPWQGPMTGIYQQIGNAVPPYLAEAVLRQSAADIRLADAA